MKILLIINRILFFVSFFLPFIFIPNCEGPMGNVSSEVASENEFYHAMTTDTLSSNNITDCEVPIGIDASENEFYHAMTTDTLSSNNITDTTIIQTKKKNIFTSIHEFLLSTTQNSISGYGLAFLFLNSFHHVYSLIMPFCFLFSIVGLLMLFNRKSHKLETIIIILSLIFLIVSFIMALFLYGLKNIMWGFWTSLFLSLTNVIITIITKRKYTSR